MGLADKILRKYKEKLSGLELSPYGDGRFEVFAGDEKIYSKLDSGDFPEDEDILKDLDSRV